MGDESNTAQVHPQKLSQALMEAAQQKGAHLRIGEVQNIITSGKTVKGKHAIAIPPVVVQSCVCRQVDITPPSVHVIMLTVHLTLLRFGS